MTQTERAPRPSGGRKAQSKGKGLEGLVVRSAERQKAQGLHLTKTGVGFAYQGRSADGRMVGVATNKGQLDFVGHLRGRLVTFDAKSCDKTALPLSSLRRHQVTIVKRRHAEGCVAFFLVELTRGGAPSYHALTWPVLQPYWDKFSLLGTPASIPVAVLQSKCPAIARGANGLDLVAVLEQLGREVA